MLQARSAVENKPEKSHKRLLTHLNLPPAKFSLLIVHRRKTMYKTAQALGPSRENKRLSEVSRAGAPWCARGGAAVYKKGAWF